MTLGINKIKIYVNILILFVIFSFSFFINNSSDDEVMLADAYGKKIIASFVNDSTDENTEEEDTYEDTTVNDNTVDDNLEAVDPGDKVPYITDDDIDNFSSYIDSDDVFDLVESVNDISYENADEFTSSQSDVDATSNSDNNNDNKDTDDIVNPQTGGVAFIIIMFIFLVSAVLIVNFNNKKNRNNEI